MRIHYAIALVAICLFIFLGVAQAAVDREKLLTDPGVYGTFAVFKVDESWWKLDANARRAALAEVKGVFQRHAEHVTTDTYLLRGLMEKADFFIRVHSLEILNNQNFLVDLMGTTLGKYLINIHTFNGITKKANYVPGFPDDLKTALRTPPDPGSKPYAIVVPIRKDAEWWIMDQNGRAAMMKEHICLWVSGRLKSYSSNLLRPGVWETKNLWGRVLTCNG